MTTIHARGLHKSYGTDALPASLPNTADQAAPAVRISEAQRLCWSIRRELRENRSIYMAPIVVAALIVLGFLYSTIQLPARMLVGTSFDPMQQTMQRIQPYNIAAALIMATTFLVSIFYCLDALYGERRELFCNRLLVSRSIVASAHSEKPALFRTFTLRIMLKPNKSDTGTRARAYQLAPAIRR